MGCCVRSGLIFFVLSGVALAALVAYLRRSHPPVEIPATGYWGPKKISPGAQLPKDDEKIYKFSIAYDDKMVATLREELGRTKWYEPLEDAQYHYGINLKTFRQVIDYWKTKFDFKKAQQQVNAFPHYQTEIEGLNIHFFRSAPKAAANVKVLPLLMIHGWPGSYIEFIKVAPMLSTPVDGVAFDVIVPSLPGYGYSDAAKKQGMNMLTTARIFNKLMKRLGYPKYYVQGGDWGSAVANSLGVLYPESLRGIHLNMAFPANKPLITVKQILFSLFPNQLGDGQFPPCMPIPFKTFFLGLLRESGYMHIQATKPDTVGFGLLNSPAGLAAYIIEKFSTWTQDDFRNLEDGGLGKKFSIDDVLANVMVYYATGSIISSQRYYKENIISEDVLSLNRNPINVPFGYAVFPNEISCMPRFLATEMYSNITTMTYQKDGGHFAAYEQPKLLEQDVRAFVKEVERLYPEKLTAPKGFTAVDRK